MTSWADARIRDAFIELREWRAGRTPDKDAVLNRRVRRHRVRPGAWSVAVALVLVVVFVARGALRGDAPSIATWRAASDDLMEITTPWLEPNAGSAALNELLPATLQIGGGQ